MRTENDRIECLMIPETGKARTRVECEKTLADFCEDVSRIVKADCFIRVKDRSVSAVSQGIVVRVDGECVFSVLYVSASRDDESQLGACSFTKDFSQKLEFPVSGAFDETLLWADVEINCEECVCRPLGPRKLQLKSELSVCAGVKYNAIYEKRVPSGEGLELKKESFTSSVVRAQSEKEFTSTVDVELPEALADIGAVSSCDVSLFALSPRLSGSALDFTALAVFTCTYLADDASLPPVSVSQPVETFCSLENPGFSLDGTPLISLLTSDVRAEAVESGTGECRTLALSVSFIACAAQLGAQSAYIVGDCYGIDSVVESKKAVVSSASLAGAFGAEQDLSFSFDCPGIVSVEAPMASCRVTDCVLDKKTVRAGGVFRISALAVGEDSRVKKLELERECELVFRWEGAPDGKSPPDKLDIELNARVRDLDLSVNGPSLRCEAKISADVMIFSVADVGYVSDAVTVAPREKEKGRVVFYRPDPDEDLWSVGKKFGLTQESLARREESRTKSGFIEFVL